MCDVRIPCNRHLNAEQYELHLHRHLFVKGHSIEGRRGQIEPASMQARHDELAAEMWRRGMKHASPYVQPDLSAYDLRGHVVDRQAALADLLSRCETCRERYAAIQKGVAV
jgi:hypothetical protein